MSRGQSQPRTQSGRRTLQRCKEIGKFDNVVVIDVDQCKSGNVVIIDSPECSQQRQRGSGALKKNKEWIFRGIISIDDEEEGCDNGPRNGDEGGDLDSDATTSKKLRPASSQSHLSSEESDGVDCEIFHEETNLPFKLSKCPGNGRPSQNRFGLYTESESSSSESDSSDSELMEDSSGKIRELWEKAAFKKNVRNHRFSLDDQVSASGSTSDPRNLSHDTSQENIDKENNADCTFCFTTEQCANAPTCSNSSNASNEKDNLSSCTTTLTRRKGPDADLDQMVDQVSHETAGLQDKDDQVTEEPFMCKTQLRDDGGFDNKGTSSCNKENPISGEHFFNETQLRDWTYVHHCRTGFQDKEEPVVTEQLDEMRVSIGRASSQDKEESVSGEPSWCNTQSQHEEQVNHDKASFQDKVESYPGDASLDNNHPHGETRASNERAGFADKEELVRMGPPLYKTQVQHHAQVDNEMASFHGKEKTISGEPSLGNAQPWDVTQLISNGTCLQSEEKVVLQEPSLYNSQQQDESETPGMNTRNMDGVPLVQNNLIGEREKHKETDEYKRALEEERVSRLQQLQIQAEEAQRLRKRKKAKSMRLLDMERRQKQRLEEVRETQKKDEETINLKEKLRAEIREELDKLEMRYKDMASLLRGLGIHVGGGLYPMPREINAAYKQALLKFHPDRASRSDIRQQVEAEEIFKMISRLKEKLQPAL